MYARGQQSHHTNFKLSTDNAQDGIAVLGEVVAEHFASLCLVSPHTSLQDRRLGVQSAAQCLLPSKASTTSEFYTGPLI